ncbi:MAG TPA: FkbM family methyltransferase, partial [Pyrinomonadaceae bacterium]|nr:FkbM family methyltransferase [Pyrinomonadaceae bacterium]
FEERVYLKHGVELGDGAVVFDVGANIGMFSLFVGEHCRGARVFAFEPIKPIFETLGLNAALHGQNVKVFPFGLSDEERTDTFTYYPQYSARSGLSAYADAGSEAEVIKTFLRNREAEGDSAMGELSRAADELLEGMFESEEHECRLRRLSDVIREEGIERIDFLKVDVQQAELEVLRGLSDDDWSKVRQVVMEVHDAPGQPSEGRLAQVLELLKRHGFEVVAEQDTALAGTDRHSVYARRAAAGDDAASSAAVVREQPDGRGAGVSAAELREYLRARLPEYMVPSAVVLLEELPVTRHGKIDRQSLPAPEETGQEERPESSGARTPVEEILAGVWCEVLKVRQVGTDENFFEAGGHSLLATQVMSRVREAFRVELPLRTLFERPTVRELAAQVEEALMSERGVEVPPVVPAPRTGALPLSFAQQRLWFLDQLEPGNVIYNSPAVVRLTGSLKVEILERTLTEIVRRHEVLRTTFSVMDGEPVQVINEARPVSLPAIDLSHMEEAEREAEAVRLAREEAALPFDLA